MILGTGIDILEIERISGLLQRQPGLVARILTKREQIAIESYSERRKTEYIAGRFAAKEAAAKAVGTGIGATLGFHDMEVLNQENGKPELIIAKHVLANRYPQSQNLVIHLSISHSKEYAIAQVIIEQANLSA